MFICELFIIMVIGASAYSKLRGSILIFRIVQGVH